MCASSSSEKSEKRKIVEPIVHFASLRMRIGEDDTGSEVVVSEFVRKDALLLSFENFAGLKESGLERQPVEAGENTYFSADESELFARVAGYPRINRVAAEADEARKVVVSVEPLIRISGDGMKADLAIHPPVPAGRALMQENLDQLIAEAGLVFGLDSERIARAKNSIRQGLNEFSTIPIAVGRECGLSKDAVLLFLVEIGPLAGRIRKDGTIDFRERRIMVPVSEGEVLARKVSAIAGTAGINVFGEQVEARPGKDLVIVTSGDVRFSPETGEVIATADGVLSVVRGNGISVGSRQTIDGDIDFTIGNLVSKNCLIIRGSVNPGFQVKADGDIEVDGAVNSAIVESRANVVIKGGITGLKTRISAEGDADILLIEKGRIDCGGNCVVRKQAYFTTIHVNGDIRCRQESVVVGSELVAAGSMTFGDVGSEKTASCLLAAGVVPERLALYRQLKGNFTELQDEIIEMMQVQGGRSRKLRRLEREAEEVKQQLLRLNMIPGTGLYSRAGEGDDPQFTGEEYSAEGSVDPREIGIEVFGTIQAGTIIRLGNRILVLDKTISCRLFKLSDNLKRILAVPPGRKHA